MNGFKMYIVAHRPFDYLKSIKDIPGYIPIHCGKSIYIDTEQGYLPELGDNTGDNISWKNRYYCELTGLYWIWKNDKSQPDDIVGIEHYRRYFGDDENTPLSHKHAEHILAYYDFIVNGAAVELQDLVRPQVECGEFDLGEYSVYRGYRDCHVISDMDCALNDPNAAEEQIKWEFNMLEQCDIFSMYFCAGESDQPICMYELGRNICRMQMRFPTNLEMRLAITVEKGYKRETDIRVQTSLATLGFVVDYENYNKNIEDHVNEIIANFNYLKGEKE